MNSTRPCFKCGGVRDKGADGRANAWYCRACHAQHRYECTFCHKASKTALCWRCSKIPAWERQHVGTLRAIQSRRMRGTAPPEGANRYWQQRAMSIVRHAKNTGLLPVLDGSIRCSDCANRAVCYDHRDYGKPLDVAPVCRLCNIRRGTAQWPIATPVILVRGRFIPFRADGQLKAKYASAAKPKRAKSKAA